MFFDFASIGHVAVHRRYDFSGVKKAHKVHQFTKGRVLRVGDKSYFYGDPVDGSSAVGVRHVPRRDGVLLVPVGPVGPTGGQKGHDAVVGVGEFLGVFGASLVIGTKVGPELPRQPHGNDVNVTLLRIRRAAIVENLLFVSSIQTLQHLVLAGVHVNRLLCIPVCSPQDLFLPNRITRQQNQSSFLSVVILAQGPVDRIRDFFNGVVLWWKVVFGVPIGRIQIH